LSGSLGLSQALGRIGQILRGGQPGWPTRARKHKRAIRGGRARVTPGRLRRSAGTPISSPTRPEPSILPERNQAIPAIAAPSHTTLPHETRTTARQSARLSLSPAHRMVRQSSRLPTVEVKLATTKNPLQTGDFTPTTRRRDRTFQAGGCPAPGFEDRMPVSDVGDDRSVRRPSVCK
jgi:hypothetical protein